MIERYIIIAEKDCPDCNGDGWRLTEDEFDACPGCGGKGYITEQIAILTPAQVLPYLTEIPFQGEPMANPERTPQDYIGL